MKNIETLIPDLEELLMKGGSDIPDSAYEELGRKMAEAVKHSMVREKKTGLRMSSIGQPCNRKLYYENNNPEEKEDFRPETYMKFLTGHLLEELVLFLVEQSGHKVEGQQDTQEIAGVKGHRDCVIDGVLVDVKTASTFSFKKFESGGLAEDDPFGYVTQIQSYLHAGQDDPIITDKSRAAFLVVDKTLGHMCLDFHDYRKMPLEAIYEYKKKMIQQEEPPARTFDPEPDGKSGNMKLGKNCSYCSYKKLCHPELKTYLYSKGPVYFTRVVKEPKVDRLD